MKNSWKKFFFFSGSLKILPAIIIAMKWNHFPERRYVKTTIKIRRDLVFELEYVFITLPFTVHLTLPYLTNQVSI